MLLAWMLIAQAATPQAIDPGTWLGERDYPPDARRAEAEGRTRVRLDVDRAGRVTGCEVVQTSGTASLDEATCARVRERGRFQPARTSTGKETSGRVELTFSWRLGERDPLPVAPLKAALTVRVDAGGRIAACDLSDAAAAGYLPECRMVETPPPGFLRLIGLPADRGYTLRFEVATRTDGRDPVLTGLAGGTTLSDASSRLTIDRFGTVESCSQVRDEGRSSTNMCTAVDDRFAADPTAAETRPFAIAKGAWIRADPAR